VYIENKKSGIRINLLVPVGLVTVFLINGVVPSAVMLLAAFVHELGHLICATIVGAPILRFDVELWGGRMLYGGMLSYRQELFISVGGIISNLLFAPLGLIPIFGIYGKLFYYSCFCYALINVIPACSLDGGEILRCLLRNYTDPYTADRAERAVYCMALLFVVVLGLILSLLSGFNSSVMFLVFFSIVVFVTNTKLQTKTVL